METKKLLMIVTAVIIVLAAVTSSYYLIKARKIRQGAKLSQSLRTEIDSKNINEKNLSDNSTVSELKLKSETVNISQDASHKTVLNEIKKINIEEVKSSLEELKTSLSVLQPIGN